MRQAHSCILSSMTSDNICHIKSIAIDAPLLCKLFAQAFRQRVTKAAEHNSWTFFAVSTEPTTLGARILVGQRRLAGFACHLWNLAGFVDSISSTAAEIGCKICNLILIRPLCRVGRCGGVPSVTEGLPIAISLMRAGDTISNTTSLVSHHRFGHSLMTL